MPELLDPSDLRAPRFWMHEVSGRLAAAVKAYLNREELTTEQITMLRAYLRQWIMSPVWSSTPEIEGLRDGIDSLHSRAQIDTWLEKALTIGIDPL